MRYVFIASRTVIFSEDDELMIQELSMNARPKVRNWINTIFRVYLQESYQEVKLINKTNEEYSIRSYNEELWKEMIKWLNDQDKIQDISKLTVDDVISGLELAKPFKDDKIEIIKRYKNGHYWVDLQGTRSRARDAKILKFPLTTFNSLVSKSKLYSLRDIQENPIAIILVQDKIILNIVYKDIATVQYLPFIQDFIDLKLYASINLVNLLKVNLTVHNGICYNITSLPRKLILTLPSVKFEPEDKVYIPNSATFEALDLANCKLDYFPDNVTVKGILDISNSNLENLPTNLYVTTLYMKKCLIKNLDGIFVTEQVDASNSKLSILPNNLTLSGCLNISNTDVKKLPLNLNVYKLIAANTDIKYIPTTLKVKKLDITNSCVTKLPSMSLDELIICKCNISELPENLTADYLDITDTPIQFIPESCKITKLKHNNDDLIIPKSLKIEIV
jgi:hypothetical protein